MLPFYNIYLQTPIRIQVDLEFFLVHLGRFNYEFLIQLNIENHIAFIAIYQSESMIQLHVTKVQCDNGQPTQTINRASFHDLA